MNPVNVPVLAGQSKLRRQKQTPPNTQANKYFKKQTLPSLDNQAGKHSRANVMTYKAATHLKLVV